MQLQPGKDCGLHSSKVAFGDARSCIRLCLAHSRRYPNAPNTEHLALRTYCDIQVSGSATAAGVKVVALLSRALPVVYSPVVRLYYIPCAYMGFFNRPPVLSNALCFFIWPPHPHGGKLSSSCRRDSREFVSAVSLAPANCQLVI